MRTSLLLVVLLFLVPAAKASDCGGLDALNSYGELVYPPIARAAHVSGPVIALVSFTAQGSVAAVHVISGPAMLRGAATAFLNTWTVNEFTGPRECAITIQFELRVQGCDQPISKIGQDPVMLVDLQHVSVRGITYMTCDPEYTVITTH
jgi:hypothetical protein